MINRVLIRLKLIQIVYAYYQNGDKTVKAAEKELLFSLSKAHDLYNYLLLLMIAVTDYAQERIDKAKSKLAPTREDLNPNLKFIQNKFIAQLSSNKMLQDYCENQKRSWTDDLNAVKDIYDKIVDSPLYKEYMESKDSSYQEDRELWRKLYKNFICQNETLDDSLEDISLYWNDDKEIVDTFIIKTIKKFKAEKGSDQPLLPEYKDDEDQEFAVRLLRQAIENEEYYRSLIGTHTKNWELDRIALMDIVLMQCALAEVLSFPNIPLSVTFNEYLDLAKLYSTHKSGGFINGTLDSIINQLKKEGKLMKN
ncbi:transcription antitermination factor NusB [Bacteroides sp.]|uniref:transcription antitermination factor NusB n=1 Tax=Bacteroides sp. TaxID=29523 RepID=UPI0025837C1A|nr:transcription antitermination factor NusB [Bacteroides sp.]